MIQSNIYKRYLIYHWSIILLWLICAGLISTFAMTGFIPKDCSLFGKIMVIFVQTFFNSIILSFIFLPILGCLDNWLSKYRHPNL